MAIYRDNYLRIQDLFRTIAEPTLEKQMERYLDRTNQNLEKFLNNTNIKHTLMHMYWNDKVCCENVENCSASKTRPINRDKLDAYYDYGYKINPQCNVHPCLCHIVSKRIVPRDLEMAQLAFLFRTFEILIPEDMTAVDTILKTHTHLRLDYSDQRIKANDFEKMWGALSPNLQKLGATQHDIGLVRIKTIEDSKLKSIDMTSPQVHINAFNHIIVLYFGYGNKTRMVIYTSRTSNFGSANKTSRNSSIMNEETKTIRFKRNSFRKKDGVLDPTENMKRKR